MKTKRRLVMMKEGCHRGISMIEYDFLYQNVKITWIKRYTCTTVEPVYNGPVLSGHPLLSDQFSKSRFFAHTNAVFVTRIRRPPLLSGRWHPVAVPCLSFFVIFTCIKRPPLNGN